MKDRILSIISGSSLCLVSSGSFGILHDVGLACIIAFLGGMLGYCGNLVMKKIFDKFRKKNESKES